MNVAYLVNQYPQSSQSFIRREITALEGLGVTVCRFTLRAWDTVPVDAADQDERRKTRVVLGVGAVGLLLAVLRSLLTRPAAFGRALWLTLKVGRRSDRGLLVNLVYLAEACVLLPWLAEGGAEHVHAHFGTNSTTVAMLARELGGPPYSFTPHGPEEYDRPEAIGLGEKVCRARFVVAISDFARGQLYRWCRHDDWAKIHVVRCGVDELFLTGPPPPPPDGQRRLVCVARLGEQKGQLLLVEAAARLVADGEDFELVLVGDGPMRAQLESEIARHNLSDRIRITGWMSNPEVRRQVVLSRAMVLPSFAEGLPVVLMESLALHRPVVSTYVAGIPELVEDGVSGWLVPAGSVDALADAMRRVLRCPADRLAEMGAAGAARVAERHNAVREARHLADLFAGGAGAGAAPAAGRPETSGLPQAAAVQAA